VQHGSVGQYSLDEIRSLYNRSRNIGAIGVISILSAVVAPFSGVRGADTSTTIVTHYFLSLRMQ
jgi:hypothetical protein